MAKVYRTPMEHKTDPEVVPVCTICGYEMESVECHYCHGECGWFPYLDEPFEYAPDEWRVCPECEGHGYYWECPAIPHKEQKHE